MHSHDNVSTELCNLSQGIFEKGEARGEAIGEARGRAIGEAKGKAIGEARGEAKIIKNMYEKGFSLEQIAFAADKTIEEIKAIIEGKEPILVEG